MAEEIPIQNKDVLLIKGDCLEVLPLLTENSVDSVVTDPPYHLVQNNKQVTKCNSDKTSSKGFMGKEWDGGDIAFRPETWKKVYNVLKPGGFLLSFGGTRTFHRIACAIEDAGFIIQDNILELLATDYRINAFMESLSDEQRTVFGECMLQSDFGGLLAWVFGQGFNKHRAALKPAFEPIIVAYRQGGNRKLEIDECRVPVADDLGDPSRFDGQKKGSSNGWVRPHHSDDEEMSRRQHAAMARAQTLGRWPANVVLDDSAEVAEAFAAFGESKSGVAVQRNGGGQRIWNAPNNLGARDDVGFGDSGTAARFFYTAKANKFDRSGSKHPTVKPINLIKWLVSLVTPKGGIVLDPFAGSGTTGKAAILTGRQAILIEKEDEYCKDIQKRIDKIFIPIDEESLKDDYNLGGLFENV
jgi:DNA modification methylase